MLNDNLFTTIALHKTLPWLLLFVFLGISIAPRANAQEVTVWSYYTSPPFVTGEHRGLNYDFIKLMNKEAHGKHMFTLNLVPRKRVDIHLSDGESGLLLFVNPIWIKERGKGRFSWSSPVFHDVNEVISHKSKPIDYAGPQSVYGLTMGGVLGHRYKGLDMAVAQGKLERKDATNFELNVLTVCEERGVDFTTAPRSVLQYLITKHDLTNKVHFSCYPFAEYDRYVLMNNTTPELEAFVQAFIKALPTNPKWQALKEKYQLQ